MLPVNENLGGYKQNMFNKLIDKILGVDQREKDISAWGNSIPLSESQIKVINSLWNAYINKKPPIADPLSEINDDELKYIYEICKESFLPKRFNWKGLTALRLKMFMYLRLGLGFTKEHSQIIVGLFFNRIYPRG